MSDMQDVNVAVDPQQNAGQVEAAPQYNPQQQYQPTTTYAAQPAAGGANAVAPEAVGCSVAAFKRVFFSPTGILRAVEWVSAAAGLGLDPGMLTPCGLGGRMQVFAIIAFGAMSDNEIFDKKSAFEFVVAMGVLTWIYIWVAITVDLFNMYASYPILNVTVRCVCAMM